MPRPAFRATPLHRGAAKLVGSAGETPAMLRTDQRVVRLRRRRQGPAGNALMPIFGVVVVPKHEPWKPDSDHGGLSTLLNCARRRSVRRAPTAERTHLHPTTRISRVSSMAGLMRGRAATGRPPRSLAQNLVEVSHNRPWWRRPQSSAGWCSRSRWGMRRRATRLPAVASPP